MWLPPWEWFFERMDPRGAKGVSTMATSAQDLSYVVKERSLSGRCGTAPAMTAIELNSWSKPSWDFVSQLLDGWRGTLQALGRDGVDEWWRTTRKEVVSARTPTSELH